MKFESEDEHFFEEKKILKCLLPIMGHCVEALIY